MINFLNKFSISALLFGTYISTSVAMTLTPIEANFTATGRGTSNVFRLHNDTPDPIAVDLFAKKRIMKLDGSDELMDADNDFTVVPSQISLQPGQFQSVRVQYVGPANIKGEVAYRFIAEQLPLVDAQADKASNTNAGVKILVKYIASVYVSTGKTKPDVAAESVALTPAKDKQAAFLSVVLKNTGDAHTILKNSELTFKLAGKDYALTAEQLKSLDKENILAQTTRKFVVSLPASLHIEGEGEVASVQFKHN